MQALVFIEAFGKIRSWSRVATATGADWRIVATGGHFCRFPDGLDPLGIRLMDKRAIDFARKPDPAVEQRIVEALDEPGSSGRTILIATDDDPEGDVIALDIARTIAAHRPEMLDRVSRVRPGAITREGIERAIARAQALPSDTDELVHRAIPGRARAMTDRWIGSTYSNIAGTGCGRVRAAVLGMSLLWNAGDTSLRGYPETGEITFEARSEPRGRTFVARVPLSGVADRHLLAVARRYRGRLLPGEVRPVQSAGAAVAPRFGNITPFNTGDALVHAGRFHGVPARAAMRGLQDAYMNGRISYPRTSGRHYSEETAEHVVQVARNCKIADATETDVRRHLPEMPDAGHEGLHPTPEMNQAALKALTSLIRRPVKTVDPADRAAVEDLMVCLVARRAFEAARPGQLVPGVWHPREDSDLTAEERAALDDLDWFRSSGPGLPWSNAGTTDVRRWPLDGILIEGMMAEGIGRPSTWAGHAGSIAQSGQIADSPDDPFKLPAPTPEGRRILTALPKESRLPATCRLIEEKLAAEDGASGDPQDIYLQMRRRIDGWLRQMPKDVYEPLVKELRRGGGGGDYRPSSPAPTGGLEVAPGEPEDMGEAIMMDMMG